MSSNSIRPFYADWAGYNRRTTDALRAMSPEDLALRVAVADRDWPIWAVAAHTVGARVFWLCHVFGEPGADTTPFNDPSGFGWEDDLDTTRSAEEVSGAWDSTWGVVAACLDRWTPASLAETAERQGAAGPRRYTRQSTLLRLINHEAYHVGEISLTLGANGGEPIDLWPPGDWASDAPASRREG